MKKLVTLFAVIVTIALSLGAYKTMKIVVQPNTVDGGLEPVLLPIHGWPDALCCVESNHTVYLVASKSVRSEDGGKRLCGSCAVKCIDGLNGKTPIYATLQARVDGGAIVECMEQR